MTVSSKIRLYDLAKELKLDTKRLIEEVRREGVDVSVPSNSVSKELAEKIRNKYFPKKETAAKRGVRVVKRAERAVVVRVEHAEQVAPLVMHLQQHAGRSAVDRAAASLERDDPRVAAGMACVHQPELRYKRLAAAAGAVRHAQGDRRRGAYRRWQLRDAASR